MKIYHYGCTRKFGQLWNLGTISKTSSTEISLSNRIVLMGKWDRAQKIETSCPEKVQFAQIPRLSRLSSTADV